MAILTVENLGHSFGDRTLFKDVSFRLVEGDHIGLVGANGVGKSTLMGIITGQTIHDTGKVEWLPGTHYGYLDQHTVLSLVEPCVKYYAMPFYHYIKKKKN